MKIIRKFANELVRILYGTKIEGEIVKVKNDIIREGTYIRMFPGGFDAVPIEHFCLERIVDASLKTKNDIVDIKLIYTYDNMRYYHRSQNLQEIKARLQEIKIGPKTMISDRTHDKVPPYKIYNYCYVI